MDIGLLLMEFRKSLIQKQHILKEDCDAWDDYSEMCFENIVIAPMRSELPKNISGTAYALYGNNSNTGITVKVEDGASGLKGNYKEDSICEWIELIAKNKTKFTFIEFAHPGYESNFEHVIGKALESNQLFCFPVNKCSFHVAT